MENIHISLHIFVPFVELLLYEQSRKQMQLIADITELNQEFDKLINKRKDAIKSSNKQKGIGVFVSHYSYFKWNINTEGVFYFRNSSRLIEDNQPIRILCSLDTKSIRWNLKEDALKVIDSRKKIRLYMNLSSEIIKRVVLSFEILKEKNLDLILKSLINKFSIEYSYDKNSLLNALFTDFSEIHIPNPTIFPIIEIMENNFPKLDVEIQISEALRIEDAIIYWSNNKLIIIYTKKPHKLFRKRIKLAIKTAFMTNNLNERASYFLDKGIMSILPLKKKIDFIEYIMGVLDPSIYSKVNSRSYCLLPKHYQRIAFNYIIKRINYQKNFQQTKNSVIEEITKWNAYKQRRLIDRKNIFTQKLVKEINLAKESIPEPILSEKEILMLEYLIHLYKKDVEEKGRYYDLEGEKKAGLLTLNKIKTNINYWLKEKQLDTRIFTEEEFRIHPPKILEKLFNKDLVKINKSPRKIPKYHYSINQENDYVKKLISIY